MHTCLPSDQVRPPRMIVRVPLIGSSIRTRSRWSRADTGREHSYETRPPHNGTCNPWKVKISGAKWNWYVLVFFSRTFIFTWRCLPSCGSSKHSGGLSRINFSTGFPSTHWKHLLEFSGWKLKKLTDIYLSSDWKLYFLVLNNWNIDWNTEWKKIILYFLKPTKIWV